MIRCGLRTIVGCGLTGLILAAAWFAAVGFLIGAPPVHYTAEVDGRLYHAGDNCELIGDGPLVTFGTRADAERFGTPCPWCISGRKPPLATGRVLHQPSSPKRIGLSQTRHSD